MIIIKYENEEEVQPIVDSQAALGMHLIAVNNQGDGNFLGFDDRIEPPISTQPTNKEINDNLMVVMNGLTDIYMATLGL